MRSLAGFLRRDVALTIGLALGLLLRAAGLFGFDPDAFEFRAEARLGLGSDAGDFGFERACGRFLRGALRFLRRSLAQRLRFDRALRLLVLRLLTETFELAFKRASASPRMRATSASTARAAVSSAARFASCAAFSRACSASRCACSCARRVVVGVLANAFEFGFEAGICVAADARDFGLGSAAAVAFSADSRA